MTNSDGFNINVAYGFMRMMLKLFMDKPDYLVIARDAPTKTLRHEMDESYKANRPEADPDLKRQIPYTQEIVAQLHIPSIQIPGFEADDIIATLARAHKHDPDMQIVIVSSDKDLKQLIDDNVICKDAMKEIDTSKNSFIKEHGFEPQYMLDYLILI
jgi:DNA polymerase-1